MLRYYRAECCMSGVVFESISFLNRAAPREGVYIHGLYLEGARWDSTLGVLTEAKLKDLHPPLPVVYVKVNILSMIAF